MSRGTTATTGAADGPPSVSLQLSGLSDRMRAACEEHDELKEQVARVRRELEQLRTEARVATTAVAGGVESLAEEWKRLDEAIHALFRELLGGKRSRLARRQIEHIYRYLQDTGNISPRSEIDDIDQPWLDFGASPDGESGDASHWRHPPTPSASRHNKRGAIRDLYRRLVELLHPDQVQDESDKARRTEAMKDLTVAFRESDFGRLIEIERAWMTASTPVDTGGDVEQRLAAIEAQNRELRKLLRSDAGELRSFRSSPEGRLVRDFGRADVAGRDLLVARAIKEAEVELQPLREIHDFVAAFRDGRMTMQEFLAGPAEFSDDDEDEDAQFERVLAGSFDNLFKAVVKHFGAAVAEATSRGRGSQRKRKPRGR